MSAAFVDDNAECEAVLARLYEFLDGECVAGEADEIRAHLDACDRCVEDADVAVALKALIQRCCRATQEPAPATLRTRIFTQYSSGSYTRVEYTEIRTQQF